MILNHCCLSKISTSKSFTSLWDLNTCAGTQTQPKPCMGLEPSVFKLESLTWCLGFSGGSDGKESTYNMGDLGLIPGLGRYPGGGHGNPLQYSCPENPHGQRSLMDYHPRVVKSQTQPSN